MEPKPVYIDLFAGCGGLSLGLHYAGWKGLFAVEKNRDAFGTLQHNLLSKLGHFDWPHWLPVQNHDINHILTAHKKDLIGLRGKVDLIAGGPPCQGFSTAGKRREDDTRNSLAKSYLRFIRLVQPKAVLFENVRGFTMPFFKNAGNRSKSGFTYSSYIEQELRKLGYQVKGMMVDFSQYGLPQKRSRFILVGFKAGTAKGEPADAFFGTLQQEAIAVLKEKNLPFRNTLSGAISDLRKKHGTMPSPDSKNFLSARYGRASTKYQQWCRKGLRGGSSIPDSHRFANHGAKYEERMRTVLSKSGSERNKNISKALKQMLGLNKHMFIPLHPRQPAPTLTTLPDDFVHYEEPRILTVREYARLQGFPDWFQFKGKYTTGGPARAYEVPRYTQVGNAIPPLFAEIAGRVILYTILNGYPAKT
jgi:DNA (cytosine-5)-methyltransferase 1